MTAIGAEEDTGAMSGMAGAPPPAQDPGQGGPEAPPDGGTPPQDQPGAAAPPQNGATPAKPAAPPVSQHAGFFDQLLTMLGGGPKKAYQVDPQTGKMVVTDQPTSRKDSMLMALAGALTGFVAGSKETGPGARGRSIAAGAGAGIQMDEQRDQAGRQDAKDDFKRGQQVDEQKQRDMFLKAQTFETNQRAILVSRQARLAEDEIQQHYVDSALSLIDAARLATVNGTSALKRENLTEDQLLQEHAADGATHATSNVYLPQGKTVAIDPKTHKPKVDAQGNPVTEYTWAEVDPKAQVTLDSSQLDTAVNNGYAVPGYTPGKSGNLSLPVGAAADIMHYNQGIKNFQNLIGQVNTTLGLKGKGALDPATVVKSYPQLGTAAYNLAQHWDGQPSTLQAALTAMQAPLPANKQHPGGVPNPQAAYARTITAAIGGANLDAFNNKMAGQKKADEDLPLEKQKAGFKEASDNRNAQRAEDRQDKKQQAKDAKSWGSALNPQTNEREYTTYAQANATGMAGFEPLGATDIEKERNRNNMWNDVQTNVSRYRGAAQTALRTPPTPQDYVNLHAIMNKVGALDLGVSGFKVDLPMVSAIAEGLDRESKSEAYHALSPSAQQLYDGYVRSLAAVPAYNKALTTVGRANKETLDLELAAIPNPTLKPQDIDRKLGQFQENIDQGTQGVIRFPDITLPKDVRKKFEGAGAGAAAGTGAQWFQQFQGAPRNATTGATRP